VRDNAVLGFTIRKLRRDRGLRNIDLAYSVPISRAYLSEIEKGSKVPSFAMVNDIARGMRMEPANLWRAVADEIDANVR
jgi:transcriptional regulator with XRE-family HTH domain